MRCVYCTLAISLLVGCQNQSVPVTNPFMSADRVPPPSTRTPAPGMAQPYYPGDPVPNLQPNNLQPNNVVPPSYPPGSPVTPAAPAGNWNPQPPTQGAVSPTNYQVTPVSAEVPIDRVVSVNEPSIQIQSDNQDLRFNNAAIQTLQAVEPVIQEQSVIPAQFENELQTQQFNSSPVVDVTPRAVTIRAIPTPSSEGGLNSSGFRPPSQDGFRPQGSRRREGADSNSSSAADRFGFDPQYQWLRGQLEYDPTNQQWHLRYSSQGGPSDQFGGRLLIANPMVLGNLQPGDHVQVQGQLGSQSAGPNSMVPVYNLSVVQRQR